MLSHIFSLDRQFDEVSEPEIYEWVFVVSRYLFEQSEKVWSFVPFCRLMWRTDSEPKPNWCERQSCIKDETQLKELWENWAVKTVKYVFCGVLFLFLWSGQKPQIEKQTNLRN